MNGLGIVAGVVFCVVQAIVFGLASSQIAEEKGRPSAWYFWLGFLLGVTGMAITLSLERRHSLPGGYEEYIKEQHTYEETQDYIKKLSK